MANLSLSLCFLFLIFHGSLAFQQQQQNECQIQTITALVPNDRTHAEAGYTDCFDSSNQQFRCAGVEAMVHMIQPQGLLLPTYLNTPLMVYIKQGSGYQGIMLPGCAETFQSSQQIGEKSFQDRHQKIHQFRQGDMLVIPAGAAHWMYNDGQEDIIAVVMLDSGNSINQLDQLHRRFFLAGTPKAETTGNLFRGFDVEMLAEAFNVDTETAQKLQGRDDNRGHIVKVERGLQVIRPPNSVQQEEQGLRGNGFEETICSAKVTFNIDDASRADFYNPQAGRCTNLNSYKLPILQMLQLSAERGVLHKNAMVLPCWLMNAHDMIYVTNGNMRMQIVNNQGQTVYDDQIQEGQLLVVPQNFVAVKQAGEEGCRWISFRTNDNAMINTLAGRTSALRAMPVNVIANAYQMSMKQASSLKFNRKETVMFGSSSETSAAAA